MSWLINAWYQAGWGNEVAPGTLLARTLLDTPLVIYRQENGTLAALHDQCPHRFAPLSAGRVAEDSVICGYHGLGFGPDGACSRNPHGRTSKRTRVRSFPAVERHSAIWIWMGDKDESDPSLIPDLSFIDDTPDHGRIAGYMPTRANYQLIVDNILDLSHADYLHPTTLGGMMTDAEYLCREDGEEVVLSWEARNAPVPPVFRGDIPAPDNGDFWIDVRWRAPAVMVLRAAGTPHGTPIMNDDYAITLHNMTPESTTTTHYFYCSTRTKKIDDEAFMERLKHGLERAFQEEDKPMLELQQQRIGTNEFWSLKPRILPIDKGAVMARRKLDALIASQGRGSE